MNPSSCEWQQSLPFCLELLPEEWLPAYLLRCDQANHWPVGTTALVIFSDGDTHQTPNRIHGIAPEGFDMKRISQITGAALSAVKTLTYLPDLQRVYQIPFPRASWLGGQSRFRVCPACLCEHGTLMRWTTLPYLTLCPVHEMLYRSQCLCGRRLSPFSRGSLPFTCPSCQTRWEHLPHEHGEPSVIEQEHRLTQLCQWILQVGSLSFLADVMNFLQGFVYGYPHIRNRRYDPVRQFVRHYRRKMVVIGLLGLYLASLDLSIEAIQDHILRRTWKFHPALRRFWYSMPGTNDDSYWLGPQNFEKSNILLKTKRV